MASTYTRLPTDEDAAQSQSLDQPRRLRRPIFFVLAGLLLLGFVSYKYSHWAWSGPSASLDKIIPVPTITTSLSTTIIVTPTTTIDSSKKPNNTELSMPEQGKVSVG